MGTPTINQLNDPRGFAIDPFRYSGANAPVSQPTNTTPLILNQMDGGRGNDSIESKSTPDWGTALSIGQNLSNWGLTSVGDYIQSESRMGINSQTGAYSQEAQDQRKQEAAAMSPSNVGSRSISAPSGVTVGGPMAVDRGVTGVALGPVDNALASGITASEKGGWAASVRDGFVSDAKADNDDKGGNDGGGGGGGGFGGEGNGTAGGYQ